MFVQATLGLGSSGEKSILQCFGEHRGPIFLCTLLPDKIESCFLDLEFDEDDSVTFSVVGKRSIHLSGYFLGDDTDAGEDGYGLYPLDVFVSSSNSGVGAFVQCCYSLKEGKNRCHMHSDCWEKFSMLSLWENFPIKIFLEG